MDISSLSPSQMQVAISTGKAPDGSDLSSSDMSQISDALQQALSGSSANTDSTMGLTVEKSKPQTDVSTGTITNADGSTTERTTTTTKSSAAFTQSEATVADQAVKIADNCAYQTKAGDEMGSGPFGEKALYAQKLKCVAQYGKAPEVTQDVDTKKFDDTSDPTAQDNKNACGIGFTSESKAIEYLKKSSNPEIAKLANASGDPTLSTAEKLKATRALDVQLSAMQPDMIDNAKQGQALIDDKMNSTNPQTGKNYTYQEASASVREQHPEILDKFGGPVKTTANWVLPDEWKTEEDKTTPPVDKGKKEGTDVLPDSGTGDAPVTKESASTFAKPTTTVYVNRGGAGKANGSGEYATISVPADSPLLQNSGIYKIAKNNGASNPEYKYEINAETLVANSKGGKIDLGDGTYLDSNELINSVNLGYQEGGTAGVGSRIPQVKIHK